MNDPISEMTSANRRQMEATIAAEELRQKIIKRAVIRIMASNIYGHLHGDRLRSQLDKDDLVVHSVDAALAIWAEVDRRI